MSQAPANGRVMVVGAGMVGSSIAYALVNQDVANIVMINDIDSDLAESNVLDLVDAAKFAYGGTNLKSATYDDLNDGDIVLVTAGIAQKPDQTRLELLQVNAGTIRQIMKSIVDTGKDVIVVIVSNPVDVLTYIAANEFGFANGRVFGTGTLLDSGRLRVAIANMVGIHTSNVHAHVLGEHGDSSFPALSAASIAGVPLSHFIELNSQTYAELSQTVREAAYKIIKGKRATYYGIGAAAARLCQNIIRNERKTMELSVKISGEYGFHNVACGTLALVTNQGVETFTELPLTTTEYEMFAKSVSILQANIQSVSN